VSWQLDRPVGGDPVDPAGRDVIVVPPDYQQLRLDDATKADGVRRATGERLSTLFSSGGAIDGLGRLHGDIAYVVAAAVVS
jgi:hypothetical protein